ncbi:acyl-CoA dehydrogenase [Skermania sp. ID1734]|uniref:acyl-CoA dehydrogenase family protein n=1 Tax=Skermania sp. ID1734 TaxID=2597516 RepID=UPI001180A865|nr:acyl-CoA dehydrogenase family protein [Skermania sp. ID1734]TSD95638.1 acyl-CoA dehydrogenase [Skermania sp. ID1734]
MDFSRTETQEAVAQAASGLVSRLTEAAADAAWAEIVDAGLVALALSEECGGDGLGLAELTVLLGEIGRAALPVPALATIGLGVLPLLQLDPERAHDDILQAVGEGEILTAALCEPGRPMVQHPVTTTLPEGDSLIVTGAKVAVPYAAQAHAILVPTDAGVVLVPPDADGVSMVASPSSSGMPEYAVRFDGAVVPKANLLPGDPNALRRIALACIGAAADGLLAGALELTAKHLGSRHQFGKPLATFQAVAQEIANVYVVSRTLHVAALSSSWRVAEGLDADDDLDVLAYWIAAEVPAAMQVCHHLHGGIGVDVTYPMHRYYSQAKDLARLVGGESHRLELLGARCSSI